MLNFLRKNWQIILIFALCFWSIKAIFVSGYFPSHDDEQIARVIELNKGLLDGQIPVRWVPDLGFGFGYPLFNFYPPFTYYSAEFFHLLNFSFIDSTKIVFILGFLLSSLFMYLWAKEYLGKIPAIFSAVLYVYAPYHAVETYVRGSLPESISYMIFPFVFWLTDRLFKNKDLYSSILLGVLIALIPLTHILNLVSFFPFFALYLIYFVFENKRDLKKLLYLLFLSFLVAFGLSSFFLIPAILEKSYTLVDKVNIGELYSYKLHFPCVKELFNSVWGYGGSLPDCHSGLSFEIGKIHLLTAFIALLILIYSFLKKKIVEFKFPLFIFLMFLSSVYLTNSHSRWIWDKVTILSYLQFPWRFLTFTAVFSSFLGGFVISYLQRRIGANFSTFCLLVFSLLAISIVVSDFKPQYHLNVKDSYYESMDYIRWTVSKASFEFVPKGVATRLSDIKTTQVDLNQKDIPNSPYKILEGNPKVQIVLNKSQSKIFKVESDKRSIIQLNTYSFPGWKTFIDGNEVKYSDKNKLKLITVNVPLGSHELNAEFTNTLPRALGNAITLVTVFNLLGFIIFRLWGR